MNNQLIKAFEDYSGLSRSVGIGLESSKFRKLCKDSRLFDRGFTEPDADLIFTKVKGGKNKIDFNEFKEAIRLVATKKGVDIKILADQIYQASQSGPSLSGTVAMPNKFHDDVRTYTGVHKAGGPTTIDHDKQGLENLLDRSSADVRGLKKEMKEAHGRPVMPGRPSPNYSNTQSEDFVSEVFFCLCYYKLDRHVFTMILINSMARISNL